MCQSFCLDINLENKLCNRNIFTIVSKKKAYFNVNTTFFYSTSMWKDKNKRMKLICPFALSTTSILRYCFYFIVTFYKYQFTDNCEDRYPTANCRDFQTNWNFCSVHKMWMEANCMKTCGLCGGGEREKGR